MSPANGDVLVYWFNENDVMNRAFLQTPVVGFAFPLTDGKFKLSSFSMEGYKEAVERTIEAAKAKGCKRGMMLPVSAPFHCPLMQPAADAMKEALEKVSLGTPSVPLVSNVLASEITNPADIKVRLVEQVTGLVRWLDYMSKVASLRSFTLS